MISPISATAIDFDLLDTSTTNARRERQGAPGVPAILFLVLSGLGPTTVVQLASGIGTSTVSSVQASAGSLMGLDRESLRLLSGGTTKISRGEHAIARFKNFALLQDDWDDRGTLSPGRDAIDAAMKFISNLQPWHPTPFATIDREGHPVIELNDPTTNYFGSITFLSATQVELYVHRGDRPSIFFEGDLSSPEARKFLRVEMQIALPS
jgi:hypothetical protein